MTRNERKVGGRRRSLLTMGVAALVAAAIPAATHAAPPCDQTANAQRHAAVAKRHTARATHAAKRKPVVEEWVIVRQVQPAVVERRVTVETVPQPVVERTVETTYEE